MHSLCQAAWSVTVHYAFFALSYAIFPYSATDRRAVVHLLMAARRSHGRGEWQPIRGVVFATAPRFVVRCDGFGVGAE